MIEDGDDPAAMEEGGRDEVSSVDLLSLSVTYRGTLYVSVAGLGTTQSPALGGLHWRFSETAGGAERQ